MIEELIFHSDWFTKNIENIEKYLSHLKGVRYCYGLEIGCWEGRSSIWFAENILNGEGSELTCIDNFLGNPENQLKGYEQNVEQIFLNNIRSAGIEQRIKLMRSNSNVALKFLRPLSFDFVYIDGSHNPKDVLIDLCLSWLVLKNGGIMICDDYGLVDPITGSMPKPAIDAFYRIFNSDIIKLHDGWQTIWRKI